jgi:hypothetical protein
MVVSYDDDKFLSIYDPYFDSFWRWMIGTSQFILDDGVLVKWKLYDQRNEKYVEKQLEAQFRTSNFAPSLHSASL